MRIAVISASSIFPCRLAAAVLHGGTEYHNQPAPFPDDFGMKGRVLWRLGTRRLAPLWRLIGEDPTQQGWVTQPVWKRYRATLEETLMSRGWGLLIQPVRQMTTYTVEMMGSPEQITDCLLLGFALAHTAEPIRDWPVSAADAERIIFSGLDPRLARLFAVPWMKTVMQELLGFSIPRVLATLPDPVLDANVRWIKRAYPRAYHFRRGLLQDYDLASAYDEATRYPPGRDLTTYFLGAGSEVELFRAALAGAGATGRVVIVDRDQDFLEKSRVLLGRDAARVRFLQADYTDGGFQSAHREMADRAYLLYPEKFPYADFPISILRRRGEIVAQFIAGVDADYIRSHLPPDIYPRRIYANTRPVFWTRTSHIFPSGNCFIHAVRR